ncbi:membrane protein [Gordonia phage Phlop]|uniref:Membrane protein n=7 Tax=Wizardvirus TaxID=2169658 RepID=A0A890UN28_9CAUD|nr:hypothetical protein KNU09_gp41 [Gordonia phage TillyBobJoe]YP_010100842.1 hypothetical protein KNU39_gp40 [Gordonia phage Mutzi]YP_010102003.1 hypothetical protein KNU53_gp41 [Gordonia phage SmokingBunny]YP_010102196.1 hypothetical protein KNU55_gp43 [Gordonia phage Barb]YP_010103645.1 hypothetical protein KNU68_gp41 [Gordonia phage Nubi]YP_010104256.1 hypothetical protein KNU74_gp42 [Gordonia phage Fireball]YP_010114959.1 membrane protein [Gordonia phage Phlop]QXO14422.1 membrane protei
MPTWLTPSAIDNVSVVGLFGIVVVLFMWALLTGRLVLGVTHKETRERLEKADARAVDDAKAIATLTTALTEKNASDQANAHFMQAVRDVIQGELGAARRDGGAT